MSSSIAQRRELGKRIREHKLVIEYDDRGVARSTKLCIPFGEVERVIRPNQLGEDILDLLAVLSTEFSELTGAQAHLVQITNHITREFELFLESEGPAPAWFRRNAPKLKTTPPAGVIDI